jgi:formylglycine-generating enzyme required for sulfatase activity
MPEPIIEPNSGVELLYVPGGELRMGSEEEDEDARPVHLVRVSPFWLAKYEVTRAQYEQFMKATGHPKPAQWTNKLLAASPSQPVVGVSWDDAVAFCRWAGGRLPTEAEWEFAARGTTSRRYPWGDEDPDTTRAAFHLDVGFGSTRPVGGAKQGASPFGLLDMAGNAFEWCSDWYGSRYYAESPRQDPKGPPSGEQRVIRGGAWISLPDACRAAARGKYPPASRSTLVGFRVAREAS